jgi:uncharacterized protein (DUF433 family)
MSTVSIFSNIIQTPQILGNEPYIESRRIRVKDIVLWFESLGMSADEIADTYDLTLADIYSALAYYHLNQKSLKSKWDFDQNQVNLLRKSTKSKISIAKSHA